MQARAAAAGWRLLPMVCRNVPAMIKCMDAFPSRYVNLAAARLRFGDRVDRLGHFFAKVDDAADRAVAAMDALPRGQGWRLFATGIERGPRAIADAPRPIRELIEEAAEVPLWVDWEACNRGGQLLLRAGMLGAAVLGAASIVLGYASPAGNKPLVFSGRLKEQTARRINETACFVQAVSRPDGMRPFAHAWQITLKVRLIHAQVRRMIHKSGRWNAAAWGEPLNQHDMAGTCLLFSIIILDGLRKLGLRIGRDESQAYVHLWRWTGRVIGVHPDVLLTSEAEGEDLAELIRATTGEPDLDSRELTQALFAGSYDGCVTPKQLRDAALRVAFGSMICRELIGNDLADKLGVQRTLLRYGMPMLRRLVRSVEQVRQRVPFAERSAIAVGGRYWDRVVEIGLHGANAEFGLPTQLVTA